MSLAPVILFRVTPSKIEHVPLDEMRGIIGPACGVDPLPDGAL